MATKHRQMQFNILNNTYFTPHRLHLLDNKITDTCLRCKINTGDLLPMLWSFPFLYHLKNIYQQNVLEPELQNDPKMWLTFFASFFL